MSEAPRGEVGENLNELGGGASANLHLYWYCRRGRTDDTNIDQLRAEGKKSSSATADGDLKAEMLPFGDRTKQTKIAQANQKA